MPWFVVVFCWSSQSELTPFSRRVFFRFLQGFIGTQDQGCVPHPVGEGKPRHPSHLRKALTCFIIVVAMLVRDMSLSVTVTALPLHVYHYRAMLRHYDAILYLLMLLLYHALPCYIHNHTMLYLIILLPCHALPCYFHAMLCYVHHVAFMSHSCHCHALCSFFMPLKVHILVTLVRS